MLGHSLTAGPNHIIETKKVGVKKYPRISRNNQKYLEIFKKVGKGGGGKKRERKIEVGVRDDFKYRSGMVTSQTRHAF
jgi:hypothetical protein